MTGQSALVLRLVYMWRNKKRLSLNNMAASVDLIGWFGPSNTNIGGDRQMVSNQLTSIFTPSQKFSNGRLPDWYAEQMRINPSGKVRLDWLHLCGKQEIRVHFQLRPHVCNSIHRCAWSLVANWQTIPWLQRLHCSSLISQTLNPQRLWKTHKRMQLALKATGR